LTDFPFPSGRDPVAMTSGPDGNLWIAEYDANAIARLSIVTGAITEFNIPTPASEPTGIAAGSDGNIWFTEGHVNQIGRLTP
jgi:virginiamycin B lyase